MPRQRLINCDFFAVSGFTKNLSNKAKLLYFLFLTNADDMGFVGNGLVIADNLDQCEEKFGSNLIPYKFVDALSELTEKLLTFEFSDKIGNKTYLIRHWFLHNKRQPYLKTNFVSYLAKVEIIDNEYHLKKEKPLKEKVNKTNELNELNKTNNNEDFDRVMKDLEKMKIEDNDINDSFYECFEGEKKDD